MNKSIKFERVYHPINQWEEMRFNMWGTVSDREKWIEKAKRFTSRHKVYGRYMRKVLQKWPVSCENALTDYRINRRAWLGHAACALAFRCPEDIVRAAWGLLTDEQRALADREAERAISIWEIDYARRLGLHKNLGEKVLFSWDT